MLNLNNDSQSVSANSNVKCENDLKVAQDVVTTSAELVLRAVASGDLEAISRAKRESRLARKSLKSAKHSLKQAQRHADALAAQKQIDSFEDDPVAIFISDPSDPRLRCFSSLKDAASVHRDSNNTPSWCC